MVDEIRSASLAEEEEELGEGSDSDGETEAASSLWRRTTFFVSKSPLYDFSSVVEEVPPKKGLSKFYQGKSQSFTSLLEVKSLEDLPKQYMEVSCGRKTKPCKSYAIGLGQIQKPVAAPDTCIKSNPKKSPPSNASCASSMARSNSHGFLSHGGTVPLHKRQ
ncbi:hypothetical protein HPP92_006058 [Vanilla planifolia]|uniref:Uncharacterized protein n=1 Tax=Vanilla planifolia TaxID=51239 RepID=A0A835RNS8_VANPL|nr:hypothetical protein HPP92_006058 [Vanilla planifolia]